MLDPISEMLTRIRNAQMAEKKEVFVPASKIKLAIAKILEAKKFVSGVQEVVLNGRPFLKVVLRYVAHSRTSKKGAISEISRVSRESQRIYVKSTQIPVIKSGFGVSVISTSKGVMAGDDAFKQGLGGEVMCKVW